MADNKKKGGTRGPVKVKKVHVGDPGVGFVLEIPDYAPMPLPNLQVQIMATADDVNVARSIVVLLSPTNERRLVFVIPFGDVAYQSKVGRQYRVEIVATYNHPDTLETIEIVSVNEYVVAKAGAFELSLSDEPDE
jgi:hypothetical protein